MNILLIYPKYPDTYWSFKHALRFISKKAAVPPLGLITVSAMLPGNWNKRLIDMNVTKLKPANIAWADYVFISAMYVQKSSVDRVIEECLEQGVKIVAGGPLFTQEYENYPHIDHFVLNEAEITMPMFLDDLAKGLQPCKIYKTGKFADLNATPIPDYHLLQKNKYAYMSIQVTRGCPFACDFCEITSLLGHKVRMKDTDQVLRELDRLYDLKWRGPVSIVDDNFIGRISDIKQELLPAIKEWMQGNKFPFKFNTQTSINLADDDELLAMMTASGFDSTFIGIETPDEISLQSCNKVQNKNRNLLGSIKKIQNAGMSVSGGFIIGFDSDSPTIFKRQIEFIQQSGIVSAMVGLLNAPKNTTLYHRLRDENRLTTEATGDNTDSSMNFIPKMNRKDLLQGYQTVINNIYGVKPYYKRIRQFLLNYERSFSGRQNINFQQVKAFFKSLIIIGVINRGRSEYWKLIFWTLVRRPGLFIDAMTYAVYGYHFRTVYGLRSSNRQLRKREG
jgi:radical SAM superfamily enzyme YgiQ (UPF0313 family)